MNMMGHFIHGLNVGWLVLGFFVVPAAVHALWRAYGHDEYRYARIIAIGIAFVWFWGAIVYRLYWLVVRSDYLQGDILVPYGENWIVAACAIGVIIGGLCLIQGLGQFFLGKSTIVWVSTTVALSIVLGMVASFNGVVI